jgi:hypothetical protein
VIQEDHEEIVGEDLEQDHHGMFQHTIPDIFAMAD